MIRFKNLRDTKVNYLFIHHSPYIVDFRSAGWLPYEHWSVTKISTRAARQTFWVASLLAGSTSSRPFFCFLCNLRSLHDAQARHRRTPLRSFTSIREIARSAPPVRRRGRRDPKLLQPTESQRYRCPTASQRYSATGIMKILYLLLVLKLVN